MAQHSGRQGEWPRWRERGNNPEATFAVPDGYFNNRRETAGPLRMGTMPPVGPRGSAVVADYTRQTDFGTDMIARDRVLQRKYPSDLLAREIRGGAKDRIIDSEGKRFPK